MVKKGKQTGYKPKKIMERGKKSEAKKSIPFSFVNVGTRFIASLFLSENLFQGNERQKDERCAVFAFFVV